jgi:hypothetical protein
MNWDQMIQKLSVMLTNIEYDKVEKIYNTIACHVDEPEIEHVYDPEKDEEFWLEIK